MRNFLAGFAAFASVIILFHAESNAADKMARATLSDAVYRSEAVARPDARITPQPIRSFRQPAKSFS